MANLMLLVATLIMQLPLNAPAVPAAAGEDAFLARVRQLVMVGARSGEGYFSLSERYLTFQSERTEGNPFFQVYVMDRTTGEVRRVSPGTGKATCSWMHRDERRVLYFSTHADPDAQKKQEEELKNRAEGKGRRMGGWDYDEWYDPYVTDLETGDTTALAPARGYDAEGACSPDGTHIVFASNRHAYTEKLSKEDQERFDKDPSYMMDIYMMDADGGNVVRLYAAPGYDGGPFFGFGDQGDRIVWRHFNEDGTKAEIYTMNADGRDVKQVTRLDALSWAPFFHPSGGYIIFTTNVHGFSNFELYIVDAEGRHEPVRVTATDGFDGLPAFTPTGAELAWTSGRTADGKPQIFMADWNDEWARRQLGLPVDGAAVVKKKEVEQASLARLRGAVAALSSEEMGGRLTGSEGERKAGDWVAAQFARLGLEPAGEDGTYFQEFEFTAGVSLGDGNSLSARANRWTPPFIPAVGREWRPLSSSATGQFGPAELVFAGYGIVAPPGEGQPAYDSYAGLDVKGKWVVVLRYMPEGVSPERRQHLAAAAGLRYKVAAAKERGALGVIVVSGPSAKVKEQLVELVLDPSGGTAGVAAVSVTDDVAGTLLSPAARDGEKDVLARLQGELDSGEAVPGFAVPVITVTASIDIVQERRTGRNVLARIRSQAAQRPVPVVVGAHLDHLGTGQVSTSLAREEEKGKVHPGADDNASGVAAMLELAEGLTAEVAAGERILRHDVIFAAWSGEELGLLGSAKFAGGLPDGQGLMRPVLAYLNLDMVGRLRRSCILYGIGSSGWWRQELERVNAVARVPVVLQEDSYLPSDAVSFAVKGIPVLSAFTGAHEDYHSPRDTTERIDYVGLAEIVSLFGNILGDLASLQDIRVVDFRAPEGRTAQQGGPGGGRRVYLGTVPDFSASGVEGVKLQAVARGGPAENAGVQAGDVVVGLAGRPVANLYDYSFVLGALKIGEPVEIVVQRDGQELKLTVVPESRE